MTCSEPLKRSYRSSCGFTLIEVVVSLTIMAVITGVAVAGLRVGLDSWERGSQKIQELDRRFSVERLIQRQLALAEPQLFLGSPDEVEFTSTYSLANGSSDPVQVKYSFSSGKLVYSDTSLGTSQPLGTFSNVTFRYLNKDADGKSFWIDAWQQEDIPVAVQTRIDNDVVTILLVNRK